MNTPQTSLQELLRRNPLYVFAMQEEAGELFKGLPLLVTGIGKVNAAYALGRAVALRKPDIIVNLGSAGSPVFARGAVVCCGRFIQRDMDATALGFDKYQTPFSSLPKMLEYGYEPPQLTHGICGTGDNFEADHRDPLYNVLDMEAYSLALIAMKEEIPFLCLKYITDGADGSAGQHWQESLSAASASLRKTVEGLKAG